MSNKSEFVQLEADEDSASVRDRLAFIRGQRVLIIWPEEGTALIRKLDLVLIQREAMRRAIRLALVTHDPEVIRHATELNISVFETIGASERARWKRGRSKVFTTRWQRPKDEPEPEDLMDVASRVRVSGRTVSKFRRVLVRIAVLVLLFSVTGAVAYAVIPSATVTIALARQFVQVEPEIVADPNVDDVDVENRVIPASKLLVPVEASGSIETTGARNLPDAAATGSVIFINQTESEVEIPIGTTVTTSAGTPIQFRTTSDARLAAGNGQQLEVPIEALTGSSGTQGNVDAGLINTVVGPLEDQVTVRNIAPTTGGQSRTLPEVSADDQERLLAMVRQQLQSQAYLAMLPNLSPSQTIIVETLRIAEERSDWTKFSAKPGDLADTLSLTMNVVVEALVIDSQLAQDIAFAQMASQIPRGRVIKPESVSYQCCTVLSVEDDSRIKFKITGTGQVAGQANITLLQERLAGRPLDEAMNYMMTELDLADGTTPQITLSPDWMRQMPILPVRIDVRFVDIAP
jgi:hypothetical protein